MRQPRKTASTMLQFVEWTEQIADLFSPGGQAEIAWFRGANSDKHKLIPSLYRSQAGRDDEDSDDELRGEFKRRGLPLVAERPPRDDWEWYFLMQHYGAPTRLLDWTDSALVALYFAISSFRLSNEETSSMKPAVWALNPWFLNRKVDKELRKAKEKPLPFDGPLTPGVIVDRSRARYLEQYLGPIYKGRKPPQYPISLDPTFIAQRMLVQHSHFTLHGSDSRGIDEMVEELGLSDGLFRVVIKTDAEGIRLMRWRLATLGISETTIFPDLQGLGRELNLEYGITW